MQTSPATHVYRSPVVSLRRRAATAAAMLAIAATTGFTAIQPAFAQESSTPPVETSQGTELSVADVAERANNAVVTIFTFVEGSSLPARPGQEAPSSDEDTPLGAGSGWIYSEDGYVVTNAHVVAGADSFTVQYADGTQVEATLIGIDELQDVAVLKLDLQEGETVPGVADIGDSSEVRPGDKVVAIGSPLGEFTNTVTDGTVGGLDRELQEESGRILDNLIQHDAELSPGNSGGPLLNMQGQVIGMNVAKVETTAANGASASGLNFAIDGNTVAAIVAEIIETGDSVAYPYLGVQMQLTEDGPVVMEVEPGGPADEAGIRRGDVLTGIDGVEASDETSFMDLLYEREPGETVDVSLVRNGATESVSVTLGTRPTSQDA